MTLYYCFIIIDKFNIKSETYNEKLTYAVLAEIVERESVFVSRSECFSAAFPFDFEKRIWDLLRDVSILTKGFCTEELSYSGFS